MLSTTPMTIQPQLNAGGYINDVEVVGDTAYIGGLFRNRWRRVTQ